MFQLGPTWFTTIISLHVDTANDNNCAGFHLVEGGAVVNKLSM